MLSVRLVWHGGACFEDRCASASQYFDKINLKKVLESDVDEVMSMVMRSGGASVTLTSWCNIVAFALGYVIDVPGLADFCLAASIVACVDWVCMMTLVPICIRFEALRMQQRKPIWLCGAGKIASSLSIEKALKPPTTTWETILGDATTAMYAVLSKPALIIVVSLLSVTGFVISLYYAEIKPSMPLGFIPEA